MHKRSRKQTGRKGGSKRQKVENGGYTGLSAYKSSVHRRGQLTRGGYSKWSTWAFPDQAYCCFKTYASVALTSTSGAFSTAALPANSLYRPFNVFGGTQSNPAAENLRTNFIRYRVVAAKLIIKLSAQNGVAATPPMQVGLVPTCLSAGGGVPTSWNQVATSKRGKWTHAGTTPSFYRAVIISSYAQMCTIAGQTPSQYLADAANAAYCQATTDFSVPGQNIVFNLAWQSNDGVTSTNIVADMELQQYVRFEGVAPGY